MSAKIVILLVVLVGLYDIVNAHAMLQTPPGWNTSPSTSPCTSFTATTVALATWRAGDQVAITWVVVAGDGEGPVSVWIDYAGGSFNPFNAANYTQILVGGTSASIGPHTFISSAIPTDAVCTGKNGLCTIYAKAVGTSWQSCSTVSILPPCSTNCTEPTLPPPACTEATQLSFCTALNGQNVMIPDGFSAGTIDAGTQLTYTNYLANPKVFSNNGTTCAVAYKKFLCALEMPPCAGSNGIAVGAACHSMCTTAMNACKLNSTHANLYPCADLPLCPGESAAVVPIAPVFALLAVFAFLAAVL